MTVDKTSPKRFEVALERATRDPKAPQPKCLRPIDQHSPWIDWATDPDEREDYETEAPTHIDAKILCEGCPLESLCTEAALAKNPFHGVRGSGLIFENGKRVRG